MELAIYKMVDKFENVANFFFKYNWFVLNWNDLFQFDLIFF